jgi:hypothetical protein
MLFFLSLSLSLLPVTTCQDGHDLSLSKSSPLTANLWTFWSLLYFISDSRYPKEVIEEEFKEMIDKTPQNLRYKLSITIKESK